MKNLLLLTFLLLVASPLAARKRTAAEIIDTGNARLDSLIVRLNHRTEWLYSEGIGAIDTYVDMHGHSYCENVRWWTPLLRDLLPFNHHANDTMYFDAICKIAYQTPCETLFTPIQLTGTNRRRCRRIIKELNQVIIPIYSLKIMRDNGDDKDYILPFSNDGLRQYNYSATDTTVLHGDSLITIHFSPKKKHHELLEGDVVLNMYELTPREIRFQGRIDFGRVTDTLRFVEKYGKSILKNCSVDLDYKYGKMRGHNHFDYELDIRKLLPLKAFDPKLETLDLSAVYHTDPTDFVRREKRKESTSDTTKNETNTRRKFFERLPQRMVSTTRFNAFDTDIQVIGPLNPAGFGYDHINGITIRQPLLFTRQMDNGQQLRTMPEIGYAFRLREFRYKWQTDWVYRPERRATLTLRLQNGTNGFSSRYKNQVNELINQYVKQLEADGHLARVAGLSFDSLGLQFFRSYEFTLENAIELTNGLMFHAGATYSIRRPIRHGSLAQHQQALDIVTDNAIEQRYLDLNPYVRFVWTPRQYYFMEGRQKRYLKSQWPTFALEVGKGIKNVLKSRTDYFRIELDAQQLIRIGSTRNLSWHIGAGRFLKQHNEYFVNYTYFSRSQYPSTWNHRTSGGTFALLDDHWYSSSSGYIQQHVMFECPFLLLHNWRLISKYIIKERIYSSQLWARGKNAYCEWGYGIGNNYFNASLFCGFVGLNPFDFGAKFSIEIDQHL